MRAAVKPELLEKSLAGPFIAERRKGVPASQIAPELARPMFERMATLDAEDILDLGEVFELSLRQPDVLFACPRCESCGESTVTRYLRVRPDGKRVCIPCAGEIDDYPQELAVLVGGHDHAWPVPWRRSSH